MLKKLLAKSLSEPLEPLREAELILLSEPESGKAVKLRCVARDFFTAVQTVKRVAIVPTRGVDSSALICNLAYALGEMHYKTALIDADLRASKAGEIFGMSRSAPGLSDMLDRKTDRTGEFIINPWLTLIPAGRVMGDITGFLSSPALDDLIKRVAEDHSLTIVNCPPASEYLDYTFIVPNCDSVVVVVRKDKTRMVEVVALRQQVERLRVPTIYALMDTSRSGWR